MSLSFVRGGARRTFGARFGLGAGRRPAGGSFLFPECPDGPVRSLAEGAVVVGTSGPINTSLRKLGLMLLLNFPGVMLGAICIFGQIPRCVMSLELNVCESEHTILFDSSSHIITRE
jgi:hypothetical protein